nr:rRNA (guanosine2251-2-O)-methyltransferase [Candidatus Cloacimonadota bacterium]
MKYRAEYSIEKFKNFSYDSQVKALSKLLRELEFYISDADKRGTILTQIKKLYPLCRKPIPSKMEKLILSLPEDPFRLLKLLADYHKNTTIKDSQILLHTGDGGHRPDPRFQARSSEIKLIADNLRSVFNVGSLFRSSECLGIAELILCGISPDPGHPNMEKTALGTTERVAWKHVDKSKDAILQLKKEHYTIYALETAEPSSSVFETRFDLPMALVVGNEALGIDPEILNLCDHIVYLPVLGWKNSLNVSVAAAITLYHIVFGGSK